MPSNLAEFRWLPPEKENDMFRHDLPERMPEGTSRRAQAPKVTILKAAQHPTALREKAAELDEADRYFVQYLIHLYQDRPFPRGNLDAGRINRVYPRIIRLADPSASITAYETELVIDLQAANQCFL